MKIAMVFFVTEEYKIGLDVLLHSLNKHNSLDNIDKILITNDIKNYNNFEVMNIDESAYKNTVKVNPRFEKTFYKFEAFKIKGYDRIILMDCDMLCLGDISYLFSSEINKYNLYGVQDYDDGLNSKKINTGLLVINKPMINEDVYRDLIRFSELVYFMDGGDQGIINHYLKKNNIDFGYLPTKYNVIKRIYKNYPSLWEKIKKDLCLLHFVAIKPWEENSESFDYSSLDKLWYTEYDEIFKR